MLTRGHAASGDRVPAVKAETKLQLIHRARGLSGRLPATWDRRAREVGKAVLNYRGARDSGLRAASFARLARQSHFAVATFGDGHLVVDTADREIGRAVFIAGDYERVYMRAAVDHLAELGREHRGSTFVDVGANIGTSTVDALLHFGFGQAHCFEPDPDNVRLLAANLALNDLAERASIHAFALSDLDGVAGLRRAPGNSGDGRVVADPAAGPDGTVAHITCTRLDTLVANGELDPSGVGLVWIDTQGHEARTLTGASSLLAAGAPIVVEYCPEALDANGSREALEALIAETYDVVVDLHLRAHGSTSAVLAARDVRALHARYEGANHTDLLLLRRP